MKAASENLVPVTLELGGKSPTIVAKGSVRDRTVSAIVWGKLLSGGQTCIAPDYALVHESEINAFIKSYDRLVKAAYSDGPTSEDYTSIVNDQQYSMLIDLIDDARAHGARIIEVGHRPGDATHRPHTLAPTVVLGVTDEMKIAHEEIFGPILPIFGYRHIDDAIDYVNARPRPLALYYFGDDNADRRKVLDRTTSGNVTINGTIMYVAQDDHRRERSCGCSQPHDSGKGGTRHGGDRHFPAGEWQDRRALGRVAGGSGKGRESEHDVLTCVVT
jgi:coniferyl-aldehyde dehydrogenase